MRCQTKIDLNWCCMYVFALPSLSCRNCIEFSVSMSRVRAGSTRYRGCVAVGCGVRFGLESFCRLQGQFRLSGRLIRPSFGSVCTQRLAAMALSKPEVPDGVTPQQHAELSAYCIAWRVCDKNDKKVMTMAESSLSILGLVGWANRRLLPNETVDSSACFALPRPTPYHIC